MKNHFDAIPHPERHLSQARISAGTAVMEVALGAGFTAVTGGLSAPVLAVVGAAAISLAYDSHNNYKITAKEKERKTEYTNTHGNDFYATVLSDQEARNRLLHHIVIDVQKISTDENKAPSRLHPVSRKNYYSAVGKATRHLVVTESNFGTIDLLSSQHNSKLKEEISIPIAEKAHHLATVLMPIYNDITYNVKHHLKETGVLANSLTPTGKNQRKAIELLVEKTLIQGNINVEKLENDEGISSFSATLANYIATSSPAIIPLGNDTTTVMPLQERDIEGSAITAFIDSLPATFREAYSTTPHTAKLTDHQVQTETGIIIATHETPVTSPFHNQVEGANSRVGAAITLGIVESLEAKQAAEITR